MSEKDFQVKSGARGRRGSLLWPLLKVCIVWFILAHAIYICGTALGASRQVQTLVTIGVFVVSGVSVLLRIGRTHGTAWGFWAFMATLTAAGVGVLATLPKIASGTLDEIIAEDLRSVDESVRTFNRAGETAFLQLKPEEHLSTASHLIFRNPSKRALATARGHLKAISKNSREYPSALALLKVVDARL